MKISTPVTECQSDSPGVVVMPPLAFKVSLLAGICLEGVWPWPFDVCSMTGHIAAGAFVAFLGFAFMMWGYGLFRKLGVGVPTNTPSSVLVRGGAYRYSRNPMYVGFIVILAGIGFAAGSVWLLLTVVPMWAYLQWFVIPREEAYLQRTFGQEYIEFCRAVRRWL
ncbi:methyltransferase family protein [Pseudodesulfovibrio tunisiensis]|uniref:methyltransferase family protein n=1 Tax=Pseudodesulfovibrio tunisiensis TaxID=463192 RepID=UPI001FB28711|nr:isoprenylcysteine carboxylmethyltransferase family protein [Pseudodesulfovibrio tunisiensis]